MEDYRSRVVIAADGNDVRESFEVTGEGAAVPVVVSSEPVDIDTDLDGYVERYGALLAAHLPDYEEIDVSRTTILGGDGVVRTIRWTPAGEEQILQILGYRVHAGRGYHLTATVSTPSAPELPAIMRTFALDVDSRSRTEPGRPRIVLTVDELVVLGELSGSSSLAGIDLGDNETMSVGAEIRQHALRRLAIAGIVERTTGIVSQSWQSALAVLADPDALVAIEDRGSTTVFASNANCAVRVEFVSEGTYELEALSPDQALGVLTERAGRAPVTARLIRRGDDGVEAHHMVLGVPLPDEIVTAFGDGGEQHHGAES